MASTERNPFQRHLDPQSAHLEERHAHIHPLKIFNMQNRTDSLEAKEQRTKKKKVFHR